VDSSVTSSVVLFMGNLLAVGGTGKEANNKPVHRWTVNQRTSSGPC
jgi:hypothetical protein